MITLSKKASLTLIGNNTKPAKIHHLVKAPANTPWAKEKQQSWDANKPATVYVTPETLPDGTPCSAVTVILRTKGCHWWWSSGCTFCGYFNDTRDDVSNENLHSQWELAKQKHNNFSIKRWLRFTPQGPYWKTVKYQFSFKRQSFGSVMRWVGTDSREPM